MDIEYITKLIEIISKSKVDEIEIEEDGKRIRIARTPQPPIAPPPTVFHVAPPAALVGLAPAATPSTQVAHTPSPQSVPTDAPVTNSKLHEVKSPIVGTFYRSPSPDAAAFVQVGAVVAKGTVLCIIEAMKLMNEIESDVAGKIVQVKVENGQPVEYDQVLFVVELA